MIKNAPELGPEGVSVAFGAIAPAVEELLTTQSDNLGSNSTTTDESKLFDAETTVALIEVLHNPKEGPCNIEQEPCASYLAQMSASLGAGVNGAFGDGTVNPVAESAQHVAQQVGCNNMDKLQDYASNTMNANADLSFAAAEYEVAMMQIRSPV